MQHSSVQSVQAANAGSYGAHATHVRTLLRAFPALLRSHSDVQTHQPKLGGIKHLRIKVVGVQRFDGSCGKQRIPLVIQLSCPATNVVEEFFATPVVLGVHAPFRVIEPNRRVLPQLEPVFQLWMMASMVKLLSPWIERQHREKRNGKGKETPQWCCANRVERSPW